MVIIKKLLFYKNILVNIGKDIKITITRIEEFITLSFLFGTSLVILLLGQSIFLASINFFKFTPVLCAFVISCIVSFLYLLHIKEEILFFPRISFYVILTVLIVSLIIIFYPHDNFGGTDNGVYINLAYYLAKNGSFETPGYLNSLGPGIELAKSSLPTYRIWLATQKVLLGTSVAVRGNLLLIILGLLSFFSVASVLKNRKMGLMSVALFASCMPLLWFSRETLNENLAFFLLWADIFFFIAFFKTKRLIFIIYLILTVVLLCYTRPEGFFISLFTLFSFIFFAIYKKIFSKKKLLIIIITSFLIIFAFSLFIYGSKSSFHTQISSAIINVSKQIEGDIIYALKGNSFLMQRLPLFFSNMLIKYNFFLVIFFTILILLKLLSRLKNLSSKNIYFFIIIIIILPEFIKLINPGIQILQPWFYRRYLYALLPLGYLSLGFFLSDLKNKRNSIILFSLFIIINLILSYPIIFLKHNWTLYTAMNQISKTVSSSDVIIIKNDRILGYYYPQYYLIMQKSVRAIYTFNINDKELSLKNKTYNGFSFNKLYYLSDTSDDFYKNYSLTNKQIIEVDFSQLKPSCELEYMAHEYNIKDFYLIPYSNAINYCKYPKSEIITFKKQLYLYQLN